MSKHLRQLISFQAQNTKFFTGPEYQASSYLATQSDAQMNSYFAVIVQHRAMDLLK